MISILFEITKFALFASCCDNIPSWNCFIPIVKTLSKQHCKNGLSFKSNAICQNSCEAYFPPRWLNYTLLLINILFYLWAGRSNWHVWLAIMWSICKLLELTTVLQYWKLVCGIGGGKCTQSWMKSFYFMPSISLGAPSENEIKWSPFIVLFSQMKLNYGDSRYIKLNGNDDSSYYSPFASNN